MLYQTNPDVVDQFRNDTEGLIKELSELSRRNDELITAKDSNLSVKRHQCHHRYQLVVG
jgi:protein SPA2